MQATTRMTDRTPIHSDVRSVDVEIDQADTVEIAALLGHTSLPPHIAMLDVSKCAGDLAGGHRRVLQLCFGSSGQR